jgi:succinate dehydrogenase / fumarate reductase flavoprotein subunit
MERYAPTMKDLASRDVVSRAIYLEIREGRGINGQGYVNLDATHLGREIVETRLPDIADFCRTYLGIDPAGEPIPVQPTAHYAMGGIPTDVDGRVVIDDQHTIVPGLYAAGECACVSVHGANRLGTNSLLDIVVFGKRAGLDMARFCHENELPPIPADAAEPARAEIDRLLHGEGDEVPAKLREEMQQTMMHPVGVFREKEGLEAAIKEIARLRERYQRIRVQDKSKIFNTDILEAWELGALLELAQVTAICALTRTESRGAHSREDFPRRNDTDWLKHTLAYRQDDGSIDIRYKPVVITKFQPQERVY